MLIWQPENFLMPIWYDESLICISCNNLKFLFLTRNLCNLQTPEDLWANHSKMVQPKPHRKDSPSWKAIQKVVFILLSSLCLNYYFQKVVRALLQPDSYVFSVLNLHTNPIYIYTYWCWSPSAKDFRQRRTDRTETFQASEAFGIRWYWQVCVVSFHFYLSCSEWIVVILFEWFNL